MQQHIDTHNDTDIQTHTDTHWPAHAWNVGLKIPWLHTRKEGEGSKGIDRWEGEREKEEEGRKGEAEKRS